MALAGGCEQPRTELVVRVDSEVAWGPGRRVQSIVLTVRRAGADGPLRSARTTTLGADVGRQPLPFSVGVVAAGDDTDTPVWVEALGCGDPNGCTAATAVVAQRAVVRFVAGQTLELPLLLASACVGLTCGSDERCAMGGRCEPATRAQATVRPIVGNALPIDGDAMAVKDVSADIEMVAVDSGDLDSSALTDTGPRDAGPVDTEVTDTWMMDRGTPDVGMEDTGVIDTGPRDAGPVDTEATDTGFRDTGVIDVGSRDTGPVDTGVVDTGPTLVCTALSGSRTCHGNGTFAPCCISVVSATSCGCNIPVFGCLPCP